MRPQRRGLIGGAIALAILASENAAAMEAARVFDDASSISTAEAQKTCAPTLVDKNHTCAVGEFGAIGAVAGRNSSYGRYDYVAKDGGGDNYPRVIVFELMENGALRPVAASGYDLAVSFERPKFVHSGAHLLLQIPGSESGTGVFNRESLFFWTDKGWRVVDVESWLDGLQKRLPKGRSARKGIYPDYAKMRASTPIWRERDSEACGTGGRAEISLALKDEKIIVTSVRVHTAGECGE
jgi:hypothetical protein